MNKEFIPYEQALALKELGFDEPCFGRYYYKESYPMLNPNSGETELVFEFGQYIKQTEITILAPLHQQVFRWFREKYDLDISINTVYSKYNEILSRKYSGVIDNEGVFTNVGFYDTYEEAELACLKKLIEIVELKQQEQ
jgi:hypothetical protein